MVKLCPHFLWDIVKYYISCSFKMWNHLCVLAHKGINIHKVYKHKHTRAALQTRPFMHFRVALYGISLGCGMNWIIRLCSTSFLLSSQKLGGFFGGSNNVLGIMHCTNVDGFHCLVLQSVVHCSGHPWASLLTQRQQLRKKPPMMVSFGLSFVQIPIFLNILPDNNLYFCE